VGPAPSLLRSLVKALISELSRKSRGDTKRFGLREKGSGEGSLARETANIVNDALKRALFPRDLFTARP